MSNESNGVTGEEPSKLAESSQDDADILIKLDPEDSDMPDIGNDDEAKIDITCAVNDSRQIEDEKEKEVKAEDNENDNEQSSIKSANTVTSKSKLNYVWVSNIPRNVKAADLKKLFNQIGKVSAVKILTNGKNYYGYVSMDSAELASKCVTDLQNSVFQGETISVSRNRPNITSKNSEIDKNKTDKIKKSKVLVKENKTEKDQMLKIKSKHVDRAITKDESGSKKLNAKVLDNKTLNPTDTEVKTATDNSITNKDDHSIVEDQQIEICKLKKKIDAIYASNFKLKKRFEDIQRLYNGVSVKYNSLKNEMKKIKLENRDERRRLTLDKENFEKFKKLEISRLDDERSALSKELSESKRLKESLKIKIEEIKFQKTSKRDRSPLLRIARSPWRRTSPMTRDTGLYRDNQRSDKKYRRTEGFNRERTPPPPNLNAESGKRPVSANNSSSHTPYFSEGMKPPGVGFQYRPNHMFQQAPLQPPKSTWMGPYPKDQRRGNSNPHQGNNYPNMRYNGPSSTRPPSSVVVPPRGGGNTSHYYQHW